MDDETSNQSSIDSPKFTRSPFAVLTNLFKENCANSEDVIIHNFSDFSIFLSNNNQGISLEDIIDFYSALFDNSNIINSDKLIDLVYDISMQIYLHLSDEDILQMRNLAIEKISDNISFLSIFLEIFTTKNIKSEQEIDPMLITQWFAEVFNNLSYNRQINMLAFLCTSSIRDEHLMFLSGFIWNFFIKEILSESDHYYQISSTISMLIKDNPVMLTFPNELFESLIEEFNAEESISQKERRSQAILKILPFCNYDLLFRAIDYIIAFFVENKNSNLIPNVKKTLTILSDCELLDDQVDAIWKHLRPLFDNTDTCESAAMLSSAFSGSFGDKTKSFLLGKCENMIFNKYYLPYVYVAISVMAPNLRHSYLEVKREILDKWQLPKDNSLQKFAISIIKRLYLSGVLDGSEASTYLKAFSDSDFPQYLFSVFSQIIKSEPNNESVINILREILYSEAPTLIKCLCIKSLSECEEPGQFAMIAFRESHNAMNEENVEAFLFSLDFICSLISSSETLQPQENIYPLYQFALKIVAEHSEAPIIFDAARYAAIISQCFEDDEEYDFQYPNELLEYLISNENIILKEAGFYAFYNVMLQHTQEEAISRFDQLFTLVSENNSRSLLKLSFDFAKAIVQNADPIPTDRIELLISAAIRGILPALEKFPASDFPDDFGFFDLIKSLIKKGIPTYSLYAFHCLPLVDSDLIPSVCSALKAAIKRDFFPSTEAIPLFDSYLSTLDGFSDDPKAISSLLDLLLPMASVLEYPAGEHHLLIILLNIREREDGDAEILSIVIPAIVTLLARAEGADVPLELMRGIWEDITEGRYDLDYEAVLDEAIRAAEWDEEVTLDVARVLAHFVSASREKLNALGIGRVQKYAQRLKAMMENSDIAGEIDSLFLDNPKREAMFASRINMI